MHYNTLPDIDYRGCTITKFARGAWEWVDEGAYDGPGHPGAGMGTSVRACQEQIDEYLLGQKR